MPVSPDKEVSFLESVNLSFDTAIATLDIPEDMAQYIKNVNNVYQVRFPVKIKGKVDWLEKNPNGEYEVVDFKTGKWPQSQSEVEEGLELYIYARGIEKKKEYGKLPIKASLYFIEADKQVAIDLDESKVKGVFDGKIKDLIQGIMAEKFDATPESYQCRERCQYLDICDAGKKVA